VHKGRLTPALTPLTGIIRPQKLNRKVQGATMTKTSRKKRLAGLLSAVVLGVSTAVSFSPMAVADSDDHDRHGDRNQRSSQDHRWNNNGRWDNNHRDNDHRKKEHRDNDRRGDNRGRHDNDHRWDNDNNHRWDNNDRWDNDRRDRDRRDNDRRWDNNDNRWDNGRYGNGRSNQNDYRTFTGTVTKVSNNRFDIRVNGSTYNVDSSSRLPRGLDRGDIVRVYGERYGNNDIRNASVSIIENR
jgi:hypothetical protein